MNPTIHHNKNYMESTKEFVEWVFGLVKDQVGNFFVVFTGLILTGLLTFFKKISRGIGLSRNVFDELIIINRAEALKTIFRTLKRWSGALYIHVIRYHNGEDTKHAGDVVHYDRMTVEYEVIGHTCGECGSDCFKVTGIPEVKEEWKGVKIDDDWRARCYEPTCRSRGDVNTVKIEQLNKSGQDIFNRLEIKVFKEIFICKTKRGTYTLGLSFCNRYKKVNLADGMMTLAAKNLSNNLLI